MLTCWRVGCEILCERIVQGRGTPGAMVQLVRVWCTCRHDRVLFHRCSRNSQGAVASARECILLHRHNGRLLQVRMQSKAYIGKYLNTADGVSKILRQEGLVAFTRGFEPSLWRQGVWNGMSVPVDIMLSALL